MNLAPLKVVCWLWREELVTRQRTTYGVEHVRAWRNMVERNLSLPHELICLTDQPEQVPEGVRAVPLWDQYKDLGGCFVRLPAFHPRIAEIIGGQRFVSMDLDCVVTGSLDPLFDRPEPLVAFRCGQARRIRRVQGSIFMMDAGAAREIYDDFRSEDLEWFRKPLKNGKVVEQWIHRDAKNAGWTLGTDQSWLSYKILTQGVKCKVGFWQDVESGICNWGSMMQSCPERSDPPDSARLLFFSGPTDPANSKLQQKAPWIQEYYG